MEHFASKASSGSESDKEDTWSKDSEDIENEQKKLKKVKPVEAVPQVKTDFDKVKDLVVNMEEMKWSEEFLSSKTEQFHMLMKNINTSYTIFKNNIGSDKVQLAKQLEEKPVIAKASASNALFKKLALKKQLTKTSKTTDYFKFGTQKTDAGQGNDRKLSPMRLRTLGTFGDGQLPSYKTKTSGAVEA
jgi:hypothetical protein